MRCALAWIVYGVGDFLSRLEEAFFGRWEITSIYPIYNRILLWSDEIQGNGPGPWKQATGED